jgi:hypothetical protein
MTPHDAVQWPELGYTHTVAAERHLADEQSATMRALLHGGVPAATARAYLDAGWSDAADVVTWAGTSIDPHKPPSTAASDSPQPKHPTSQRPATTPSTSCSSGGTPASLDPKSPPGPWPGSPRTTLDLPRRRGRTRRSQQMFDAVLPADPTESTSTGSQPNGPVNTSVKALTRRPLASASALNVTGPPTSRRVGATETTA